MAELVYCHRIYGDQVETDYIDPWHKRRGQYVFVVVNAYNRYEKWNSKRIRSTSNLKLKLENPLKIMCASYIFGASNNNWYSGE